MALSSQLQLLMSQVWKFASKDGNINRIELEGIWINIW